MLKITCVHINPPPASTDRSLRHWLRTEKMVPECGEPAAIVILTEEEVWHAGDVREWLTRAEGYCAEHAPEETHEARASMAEDDFLILEIPATDNAQEG